MNPAFSIVFFTTLAGSAQGLVVALAISLLAGRAPSEGFVRLGLGVAVVLLVVALGASFLHLGNKLRAWRAVLMWRTSWMSREVIVMPAFIGLVGVWWLAAMSGAQGAWMTVVFPLAALVLSAALWLCTAMIYACLRFVQEWAHPLTIANYTLIGLSSGLVLAGALAVLYGESAYARGVAPWALAATLVAWAVRAASLRRNARLKPTSTLQSATGLKDARIVQKSMGFTAGSYNTREFFHRASQAAFRRIRLAFLVFGFAVPAVLLAWGMVVGAGLAFLIALPLQYAGLVAERWFFFAQARHPQNLYYQTVS
jgi:DMSO reductase anchor subunit